ncbi:hypothetical protein M409DRAFT_21732 [Zasmidium cellare ATCC 36951]|uniref:Uncharacterized protein n=1 Tax=Zasmidium cellare ATCC 36951 TaxID=1080233 RepID=A0A6A6CMB6_ZASCE|nr:uncharacterized protein M409DRAFT_21732 [Zasmidium cellare ATCC 36951]KAF2168295.1 hypothetical protein M409DRAFT_21732 [Zasmidium cellare ATCC 36951]
MKSSQILSLLLTITAAIAAPVAIESTNGLTEIQQREANALPEPDVAYKRDGSTEFDPDDAL